MSSSFDNHLQANNHVKEVGQGFYLFSYYLTASCLHDSRDFLPSSSLTSTVSQGSSNSK
jgi:hypothetical protein